MLQFMATITQNVQTATGSPVLVWITRLTAGSVDIGTQVVFLDGNSTSAAAYQAVLVSGNTGAVFGSNFGAVTVDPSSVSTGTVTNPSRLSSQP